MKKLLLILKKYKILYLIILTIYLFFLIIGLINHEFWRDELQAWTIARDLSFIDIFKQMKWEGHPCLWHIILVIPAKLGLPLMSMGFISICFMFVSAILVMYKSPFHLPVKVLLIFSSPFLYFYSIQSRVYSIIPFFVCLLAIIYPKRMEKPLLFGFILALLVNTHIIMSCFVGIISLFFFKDIICNKKYKSLKHWCALGFIVIGILLLYLQIYESLSLNSIVQDLEMNGTFYPSSRDEFVYEILYGYIDEFVSYTGIIQVFDVNSLYLQISFFLLLFLVCLIFSFRSACISFISFIFIFLIHVFIWFSLPQRAVMFIILLMFGAWIHYHDIFAKKKKWTFIVWEVILSLFCILSIPYGVENYEYDVENPVSGAVATADYIENNLNDVKFVCPVDYVATSITGYIDKNIFYSNIRQDYFTFVNWDSYWRKDVTYDYFVNTIYDFISSQDEDVYMIYSKYFMWNYDTYIDLMIQKGMIEQIYKSPEGVNSETYWIYKFINNYEEESI